MTVLRESSDDTEEAGGGGAGERRLRRPTSPAGWVFAAYVAAAVPLLLFVLGDHYWFLRDDWIFITERELDAADDLFGDHNGHWSTVPVVVVRVLYGLFGLRSYLPYQLAVVLAHVGVVVLVRVVMRRAGVGPWLATVAAGSLVLLGAGSENIIWGFQVGLTGAVFWALLQLVAADHDGPVGRRDALALGAGLLAIASAGTAVPVVMATGLALLVRCGWRRAALQTVPLGVAYVAWTVLVEPESGAAVYGRPDLAALADWFRSGTTATIEGIGQYAPVAWALVVATVAGGALLATRPGRRQTLRRVAAPLALLLAAAVFMLLTAQARWIAGPEAAAAGRYVYVGAVLVLPLFAVAAQALADRWPVALPVALGLLLVGVPGNVAAFDDGPFNAGYHARERALVTAAPRVAYADRITPRAAPVLTRFASAELDMGFLRQAVRTGKLPAPDGPLSPELEAELAVRLHLRQIDGGEAVILMDATDEEIAGLLLSNDPLQGLARCRRVPPSEPLEPAPGTVYLWDNTRGDLRVRPVAAAGAEPSPWVEVSSEQGAAFAAEGDAFTFEWRPAGGEPFDLCVVAP